MLETQETWIQSLSLEDPLEKEMATHSSICAGKFLGQRNLVGYHPWGRRVGHNCVAEHVCRAKWVSGFPRGSDGKASAYNAGDPGLIPGSGRSPGEGNGNPLQYSCLENPMD